MMEKVGGLRALLLGIGALVFAIVGYVVGQVFMGESLRQAPPPEKQYFPPRDQALSGVRITDLAVLRGVPEVLEIATDKGLYESADGGATFSSIAGEFVFSQMTGFTFDPVTADVHFGSGKDLRSTTEGMISGRRRASSSDVILGKTAISAIATHPSEQGIIVATDKNRLHYSRDNGGRWSRVDLPAGVSSPADIAIAGDPATVLVVSDGGIWRVSLGPGAQKRYSKDQEAPWALIALPRGSGTVGGGRAAATPEIFAVAGATDGFLAASDIIFRADDRAESWRRIGSTGGRPLTELALELPDGERVYGVTAGDKILVSRDSGRSWKSPAEGGSE